MPSDIIKRTGPHIAAHWETNADRNINRRFASFRVKHHVADMSDVWTMPRIIRMPQDKSIIKQRHRSADISQLKNHPIATGDDIALLYYIIII